MYAPEFLFLLNESDNNIKVTVYDVNYLIDNIELPVSPNFNYISRKKRSTKKCNKVPGIRYDYVELLHDIHLIDGNFRRYSEVVPKTTSHSFISGQRLQGKTFNSSKALVRFILLTMPTDTKFRVYIVLGHVAGISNGEIAIYLVNERNARRSSPT